MNRDQFLKELDATGEAEVRKRLAAGVYGNWKHDLIEAWLANQQTAANNVIANRQLDAAENTSFWTKVMAIVALAAFFATCIGIWISS